MNKPGFFTLPELEAIATAYGYVTGYDTSKPGIVRMLELDGRGRIFRSTETGTSHKGRTYGGWIQIAPKRRVYPPDEVTRILLVHGYYDLTTGMLITPKSC
jgi:hypothetical protein